MQQIPHIPDLVISDTHLGHRKITEYCLRDNSVMQTPDMVDQLIVSNWNYAVSKFEKEHGRAPLILHLGDVGRMRAPDQRSQDELLMSLRGDKYTLRGNHDHWTEEWIEEHGFKLIEPFSFSHKSWAVVVTHYPLRAVPTATINVHGHTHNNPFNSASRAHRNVSVEMVSFMPRPFMPLVESSIRLVSDVPDHIDYNQTEANQALNNMLRDLKPRL